MSGLNPQLLDALVQHQSQPERILELFREADLAPARLTKINETEDTSHPYSRVVLSAAKACEVMLARWTPSQTCAPHDHGASAGWVFYLEQDFEEQSYGWRDGRLEPAELNVHRAGSHTRVRHGEIHSCLSKGRGLSLHVYFPRIEGMHVFDLGRRRTVTVADDCGAWIPSRPEQRVQEAAWAP